MVGGVKPINIDCFDKLQFSDYVTILHVQSFCCIYDARFTQLKQGMRNKARWQHIKASDWTSHVVEAIGAAQVVLDEWRCDDSASVDHRVVRPIWQQQQHERFMSICYTTIISTHYISTTVISIINTRTGNDNFKSLLT